MVSKLFFRAPAVRASIRAQSQRPFSPISSFRFKSDTTPSSSDANYGAPTSPSGASHADSNDINTMRSTKDSNAQENTGISKPVSSTDSVTGMSEEEQPGVGDIHQPADKPAGEKAQQTLKQGQKKLDPADE